MYCRMMRKYLMNSNTELICITGDKLNLPLYDKAVYIRSIPLLRPSKQYGGYRWRLIRYNFPRNITINLSAGRIYRRTDTTFTR
jgi:hypothetical protein